MTAATAERVATPAETTSATAGTGTLLRLILRRDRVRIPLWVGGIAFVQIAGSSSYPELLPTLADRLAHASVMTGNPAMKAMTGPGHGLDGDPSLGALMATEYLGFVAVFAALMAVLLVVRHTRTEEETGRAELVRASVVGRHAHLTAAVIAAALASIALGSVVALGIGSLGIEGVDWLGSLTYGGALAAVGLVFTGVAAVTSQVSEYGRAASGMAGALIGLAYGLRAIGDVGDNALIWLSPIGWAQASAPYVDNNWWPLALSAGATLVLVALAYSLASRRDFGAGLRRPRPGSATGSALLGTPMGLAWRLQRSGLIWWAVGLFIAAMAFGATADALEAYSDNELLQQILESIGGATLTESFLAMMIVLVATVCAVFSVLAALRLRREETSGTGELVLATAVSRTHWVFTHVLISLLGGAVLLLVAGAGVGLSAAAVTGDAGLIAQSLGASLAYAPALWVTAGLAVAVLGIIPRAAALPWALVVYAFLVVYLGGLLRLPQWALDLSPYTHIPTLPVDDFSVLPAVVLTLVAAVLVGAGLVGFRQRDLEAT